MMYKDKKGNAVPYTVDKDSNLITEDYGLNQSNTSNVMVNQIGYDSDSAKIATIPNMHNFPFSILKNGNPVYTGKVMYERADFSDLGSGDYQIKVGTVTKNIKVADKLNLNVSKSIALAFMEQARQDAFDVGGKTGYAWRDSHQFSFEMQSLVLMYIADPGYWQSIQTGVYRQSDCEYTDLRTRNVPNLIWLMLFAMRRYRDWNINKGIKLHGLIKEQCAYFLWLYPQISQYVTVSEYQQYRDWLISIWSDPEVGPDKVARWYAIDGENHNLYQTQSVVGTVKGMYPAGHEIVPNLMMVDVCKRDGLPYTQFEQSARNNLEWLVNLNITQPEYLKGQRMSEWVTIHNLTMAYQQWGDYCPTGTGDLIRRLANTIVSLSNNKWDYTMYDADHWNNLETGSTNGLCNIVGNTAGQTAVCNWLADCLPDGYIKDRLRVIATAHVDHIYGRNPLGRHYSYKAVEEWGATKGWAERLQGGYGKLTNVTGVLDGSCKEWHYPYAPSTDYGYTEGWVAHNTAWMASLSTL